jgi:hypothetical protein
MNRRRRAAILVVTCGSVILSGCSTSTLVVRKADTTTGGNTAEATRVGVPYSLPFNSFKIDITRVLVACGPAVADVHFKAAITSLGSRPDPVHSYVLDPNSMAGWTRTSDVKLEYFPSGAPKSLNVAVEDRTAAVVANVVSIASKVVLIAAAAGGPGAASMCTTKTDTALANITKLKKDIAGKKVEVQSKTDALKALVDKVGGVAGHPDKATKKQLSDAYDNLTKANDDLADLSDQLEQALTAVTETQSVIWPRNGDEFSGVNTIRDATLAKWFKNPKDINVKHAQFDVAFAIDPISRGPHARLDNKPQLVVTDYGIPYRPPVAGIVRVCQASACEPEGAETSPPIARLETDLLQWGNVYYLACISRPFSNITCAFELTETGQIQSIGTANKTALAEGATSAGKSIADGLADLQTQLAGLPLAKTQAKVAELKAKQDLAAAEAAQQPDPVAQQTAAAQAQAELAKAKLAQIEAEEALRAANNAAKGP